MRYGSILIISDQHFPYEHQDLISFLRAIKKKYNPDKVINIGDEVDYHAISFHDSDPDLLSAGDELNQAKTKLKELYKLFPTMDLVESNHGSLVYRKALANGLPKHVFKDYREILEAPKGYKWHHDLVVTDKLGNDIYFCHGKSNDVLKVSQSMGMSVVQGHYHERFEIRHWSSPKGIYFGMNVGCLIDNHNPAFKYNKLNLKVPILGVGLIINGCPILVRMILDKKNRWIGKLL